LPQSYAAGDEEGGGRWTLLGAKIKNEFVEKCIAGVSGQFHEGEHVVAVVKTNKLKPMIDVVIVTNARVMGISSIELASKGPKLVIRAGEIRAVRTEQKRFSSPSVTVDTVWDTRVGLGQMAAAKEEGPLFTEAIESLRIAGMAQAIGRVGESKQEQQAAARSEATSESLCGGVALPDQRPGAAITGQSAVASIRIRGQPGGRTGQAGCAATFGSS
jgi:hypothetical protein